MRVFSTAIAVTTWLFLSSQAVQAQFWDPEPEPSFPAWPLPPPPSVPPPPPPPPSSGGATTLFVGTAGETPNKLDGYGISTSQIDPLIAYVPGIGANYTRNEANKAFNDLRGLEDDLVRDFKEIVEAQPYVGHVKASGFNVNPIKVRLYQTGTSISAEIGEIDLFARANADIPFLARALLFSFLGCPDPNIKISANDINIGATYNVYTGGVRADFVDFKFDADIRCGFYTGDIIAYVLDALIDENDLVQDAIRDALKDNMGFESADTLFSIKSFLDGLREYGDEIENNYNNLPQSATINLAALGDLSDLGLDSTITVDRPTLGFDISDEVNRAIDAADRTVQAFQGTSLQLDFMIYDGPSSADNQISLIASHRPIDITRLEYTQRNTLISYRAPANTKYIDIFTRPRYSNNWTRLTRIPRHEFSYDYLGPALSKGTEIVAVGESALIDGLHSLPGRRARVNWDFFCHGNDPECREVY